MSLLSKNSDRDGRLDGRVGIVIEQGNIFVSKVGELANLRVQHKPGQGTRSAAELFVGLVNMVIVEVKIAAGVDEVAGFEIADLRYHAGEERVGGDIERHAEEEVGAALVKLATEFAVEDE